MAEQFPLCRVPTDVLREIVKYWDGVDLSMLYCCGNKALAKMLQSPRVVLKFDLSLSSKHTRKWPTIISYYKNLRELRVKGTFPTHFEDIFGFPKSLEVVEFEFWEAESCFAVPDLFWRGSSPANVKPMDPVFADMATLLPRLQHLTLEGSNSVSDYFISTLPRTLQTLHLKGPQFSYGPLITEKCLDLLPPSLTSLRLLAPFISEKTHVLRLPRTLTSLELSGSRIAGEATEGLPPHLISLILPDNETMKAADLAKLPKNLKLLHLTRNEDTTLVKAENLPPNLEELVIWRFVSRYLPTTGVDVSLFVEKLPRTLTSLKIQNASRWNAECMVVLPSNLKHLTLHRVKDGMLSKDSFTKFLPKTLLSLALFCEGSLISGECFRGLPRGLLMLELSTSGSIEDHHVANLPKNLTKLDLSHDLELTNECVSDLPRSLKKLYLRHNTRINGSSARDLPESLEILVLSSCRSFESEHFKELPRSLTSLAIRKAKDIYGSHLADLPRGLRYLDIYSASVFAPQYLHDLPVHIRHISLPTIELCNGYTDLCEGRRSNKISQDSSQTPPERPSWSSYLSSMLLSPINSTFKLIWRQK